MSRTARPARRPVEGLADQVAGLLDGITCQENGEPETASRSALHSRYLSTVMTWERALHVCKAGSRAVVWGQRQPIDRVISFDIETRAWFQMADILIRDLPDDVLAAIDANAKRSGLSRTAYLRRVLARERRGDAACVTVNSLERFAERFADLDDPEVMRKAWS